MLDRNDIYEPISCIYSKCHYIDSFPTKSVLIDCVLDISVQVYKRNYHNDGRIMEVTEVVVENTLRACMSLTIHSSLVEDKKLTAELSLYKNVIDTKGLIGVILLEAFADKTSSFPFPTNMLPVIAIIARRYTSIQR